MKQPGKLKKKVDEGRIRRAIAWAEDHHEDGSLKDVSPLPGIIDLVLMSDPVSPEEAETMAAM